MWSIQLEHYIPTEVIQSQILCGNSLKVFQNLKLGVANQPKSKQKWDFRALEKINTYLFLVIALNYCMDL